MVQQHLLQVLYPIFPRYHTVTRGPGQVAGLKLRHRLPGAIKAQELKVLQLQILSPCFGAPSWGEKKVASGKGSFWQRVPPSTGLLQCPPWGLSDGKDRKEITAPHKLCKLLTH